MKDYNHLAPKKASLQKAKKNIDEYEEEIPFNVTIQLEVSGTITNNVDAKEEFGYTYVSYENVAAMRKQLITAIAQVIKEKVRDPQIDVNNPKIRQYGWGKLGLPESFKNKRGE